MPVVVPIKTPVDLGENINLFNGGLRAAVFYLDQPCEEAMNNAAVCRSIGESPLLKKRYLLLYIRCILLSFCLELFSALNDVLLKRRTKAEKKHAEQLLDIT